MVSNCSRASQTPMNWGMHMIGPSQTAGTQGPMPKKGSLLKKILLWVGGIFGAFVVLIIVLALTVKTEAKLQYTVTTHGDGTAHPVVQLHVKSNYGATITFRGKRIPADPDAVITIPASDLKEGKNEFEATVEAPSLSEPKSFPVVVEKPTFSLLLSAVASDAGIKDGQYQNSLAIETEASASITLAGKTMVADPDGKAVVAIPVSLTETKPWSITASTKDGRSTTFEVRPAIPEAVPVSITAESKEWSGIVKGSTLPGAVVTVEGKPVKVSADGSFTYAFEWKPASGAMNPFSESERDVVITAGYPGSAMKEARVTQKVSKPEIPGSVQLLTTSPTTKKQVELQISAPDCTDLWINGARYSSCFRETKVTYPLELNTDGPQKISVWLHHPQYKSKEFTFSVVRELSPEEKEQAEFRKFMAEVNQEITTRHLTKAPDRYKGEKVRIRGEILQIEESDGQTFMLVHTGWDSFLGWSDPLVALKCDCTSDEDLLDGDIVDIAGIADGAFTYDTKIGGRNTVPLVRIEWWIK